MWLRSGDYCPDESGTPPDKCENDDNMSRTLDPRNPVDRFSARRIE